MVRCWTLDDEKWLFWNTAGKKSHFWNTWIHFVSKRHIIQIDWHSETTPVSSTQQLSSLRFVKLRKITAGLLTWRKHSTKMPLGNAMVSFQLGDRIWSENRWLWLCGFQKPDGKRWGLQRKMDLFGSFLIGMVNGYLVVKTSERSCSESHNVHCILVWFLLQKAKRPSSPQLART